MYWELWDVGARNRIADFESEAKALQTVREIVAANRPGLIDNLTLLAMYDDGEARDAELPPALDGNALKARLAELAKPEVTEAAYKVHRRIRKWLMDEGWNVEDVDISGCSLNIMVTLADGQQRVNLFQLSEDLDHITVALHTVFTNTDLASSPQVNEDVRQEIIRSIERDTLSLELDFAAPGLFPMQTRFSSPIYFDGLTKDMLIRKILLILRATGYSGRMIGHGFKDAGLDPKAAEHIPLPENVRQFPEVRAAAS